MLVRPCDSRYDAAGAAARTRLQRGAAVDWRRTMIPHVVDSEDLMPRVLDFLGMGDAFTGNAGDRGL